MEIILIEDIDGLGKANDIVTVKNGFGRNYLIPKRLAVVANNANKSQALEMQRQTERKRDKMLSEYRLAASKLENSVIKVGAKVGTSGKIFGSVTNIQLADAIKNLAGVTVDRKKVTILEEVKHLGTFTAQVDLHPEIKPTIKFEVVAD